MLVSRPGQTPSGLGKGPKSQALVAFLLPEKSYDQPLYRSYLLAAGTEHSHVFFMLFCTHCLLKVVIQIMEEANKQKKCPQVSLNCLS